MKRRTTLLALLLLLAVNGFAHAQFANTNGDLCHSHNNADAAIKHCTSAIEETRGNNELLAQFYVQRGIRWGEKGDHNRAIADHTAALKLDAKVRLANYYRGRAYANKGEPDLAIADFDAAAKLREDDPVIYHARGIELAVKGDYARAIGDFEKALQLDPKSQSVIFSRARTRFYAADFARAAADFETAFAARPNVYTALWLYLARARGGNADAEDLLERETRRLRNGWPAPLIALYLGRTDIASVNIATQSDDAASQREMRCEADYYIAQSLILKKDHARAQPLLQGVARECPKNLLEYEASLAELRRLK